MGRESGGGGAKAAPPGKGGAGSQGPAKLASRDIRVPPNVRLGDGEFHKGTVKGFTGNSYIQRSGQRLTIYNRGGGAGTWFRHSYLQRTAGVTFRRRRAPVDTGEHSLVDLVRREK